MGLRTNRKHNSFYNGTRSSAANAEAVERSNATQLQNVSDSERPKDAVEQWVIENSNVQSLAEQFGRLSTSSSARQNNCSSDRSVLPSHNVENTKKQGKRRSERAQAQTSSFSRLDSQEDDITVPLRPSPLDVPRRGSPAQPDYGTSSGALGIRNTGEYSGSIIEAPSLALNLGNTQSLPHALSNTSLSRIDKVFDDSIAFEVPNPAFNTGQSSSMQQYSQASPSRATDVSENNDARSISISLHLPSKPANSASLSLHPSQGIGAASNSRLAHDPACNSEALDAPSLQLSHHEPLLPTTSFIGEGNSPFSFPSALDIPPYSPQHNDEPFQGFSDCVSPSNSALHMAAFEGDVDALKQLLGNARALESLWTPAGTPLHFAVQGDNLECVQMLLDAGMDIDAENGDGITPLMQAALMGRETILIALLNYGACISKAYLPGSSESLLHFCVEHVRSHLHRRE